MPVPIHPTVDIVVPVLNEEDVVAAFHQQLRQVIDSLPYSFSIYYVNDGSTDHTAEQLQSIAELDQRVTIIELSRSFGHQPALTAGLDQSEGDYVITMDGDGQHPPELITEMLKFAQEGYDMVLTQRMGKEKLSTFKNLTSSLFYRLINLIGDTDILAGGADYRLLSRKTVSALRRMREYHRFLRGMVTWMGYRTVILPYRPTARLAGQSKYSLRKMFHLGMDAVFSFSLIPLYIGISVGILFLILAFAEMIYVLSFWVSGYTESLAPGWSSLMFVLLVVGGSLMVSLGFIGIYIGYIFQEIKRRPIYLIRSIWSQNSEQDIHPPLTKPNLPNE